MGETIGFVGLGQMGRAMAERLGQAGHQLRVWNRTRERAEGIQNATVCATPREAASGAAVVLSSLADDGAVRAVVYGADGVLAGLGEGSPHAGLSTISPALGRELAERHSAAGRVFVSAPVVGRPDAAAHGQLWILTGVITAAVAPASRS